MSESEGFLARWLRLKREANSVPEAGEGAATGEGVAALPGAPAAPPGFDPASLPDIASITHLTDIRQFLQAGVPAELTRAALRAAWVADPAIRDFVGIADSQWDFNDPNAMPGFGPLDAADSARGLAERAAFTRTNTVAEAIAKMPPLPTQPLIDSTYLPREGQVDGVWLSGARTQPAIPTAPTGEPPSVEHPPHGGQTGTKQSTIGQTVEHSSSVPQSTGAPPSTSVPQSTGVPPNSEPRSGRPAVRIHGTALPKAPR